MYTLFGRSNIRLLEDLQQQFHKNMQKCVVYWGVVPEGANGANNIPVERCHVPARLF